MIIQLDKEIFYNSYIHCYHGLHLLNEEKCGDAVKFLQESKSEFIKCEKFCKQYRHGTLLCMVTYTIRDGLAETDRSGIIWSGSILMFGS